MRTVRENESSPRVESRTTCLEGFSRSFTVLSSLLYLSTSFLLLLLPFLHSRPCVFSTTPRSSPGTREIFVRIKALGINIPRSREGAGLQVAGAGGAGDGDGRSSGGVQGGYVRASLARETTGALPPLCLPTPSPPHLSKLTPFLSFSRSTHSFFVLLFLSLSPSYSLILSLSRSPSLVQNLGTALKSRSFSPVSDSRDPLLSYTRRRSPS